MKNLTGKELLKLLMGKYNLSDEGKAILEDMKTNIDNLELFDDLYLTDGSSLYVEQDEYEHHRAHEGDYDSTRFTGKKNLNWVMDL